MKELVATIQMNQLLCQYALWLLNKSNIFKSRCCDDSVRVVGPCEWWDRASDVGSFYNTHRKDGAYVVSYLYNILHRDIRKPKIPNAGFLNTRWPIIQALSLPVSG
jgi:hypothetical protein